MSDTPPSSHAVFLSYAREDSDAARRIADALRGFGVEVWFDQSELRGGDAWDQKIRGQIKDCTLFVPIISAHTEARGEGYFRLEWKLADERTNLIAKGVPFLLPVVVDATSDGDAMVPDSFRAVQWTRLADGAPTPEFVAQVKRLLEAPRKSSADVGRGRRTPPPAGVPANPAGVGDPALQPKPRVPGWTWAVVAAAIGAAVFFAFRPTAKEPLAATKISPAAPTAPAVNDKSIAVIPFENRSTDKEANAVFTDGIHEDILTQLGHIRELRVVSRTSVEQYRGTKKLMAQIGRELGVAYILEGSVQRDGNKVRVTGQLIRAATDEHVWADNYTRDLTDIFAIQSELAQAIAGELKTAISPQEKSVLERKPTENLAAYELWMKVRDLAYRDPSFAQATAQKLESQLLAVVDLDPKFAAAWGDLAAVHARHYFVGFDRTPARLAKAKAAMDRAVSLAPDSPEVIANLGVYYYQSQHDYVRATEQFEKLLRMEPNSVFAWNYLGVVQRSQGRWAEAIASTRKSVQLDPASIGCARNLLGSLRYVRRFDEALAVARRLAAMDPEPQNQFPVYVQTEASATGAVRETEEWVKRVYPAAGMVAEQKALAMYRGDFAEVIRLDKLQPYGLAGVASRVVALNVAEIHQALGDQAAARARLEDFPAQLRTRLETEPTNTGLWQALSRMEAILGNKAEALRCAVKATELPEAKDGFDGPPAWINLAVIHAWAGDKERAIAEFAEILRKPSYLNVNLLKTQAAFAPLRGDPKFEALLTDPKNSAPLF